MQLLERAVWWFLLVVQVANSLFSPSGSLEKNPTDCCLLRKATASGIIMTVLLPVMSFPAGPGQIASLKSGSRC